MSHLSIELSFFISDVAFVTLYKTMIPQRNHIQ